MCVCVFSLSGVSEERRSLITEKIKMKMEEDPEVLVKGKDKSFMYVFLAV